MTQHIAIPAQPGLPAVLAALPRARLVGGAVRDALLGLPAGDVDLATPDPPDQVMAQLAAAGLRAIPTGLAHGTVTALSAGTGFEITTLRRDLATDGRHAEVEWSDDWREDASRRDFTINAMSASADGRVFDYFDGIEDLRAGRLRFVGDPAARIAEDYLRILRFFRFYARYARLPPDAPTQAALAAGADGLNRLSAERIWAELRGLLAAPAPLAAVTLMDALGILPRIMPEGASLPGLPPCPPRAAPADALLRLSALLCGDVAAFAARLKLSGGETQRLLALRTAPVLPADADDAALRRARADHDAWALAGAVWLSDLDKAAAAALAARINAMAAPVFPVSGRDGLALGASPGPELGRVLAALRDWWLQGGCIAGADACRTELARLLASRPR